MKHRKLVFTFTSGLILFVLLFVTGIFRFGVIVVVMLAGILASIRK